MLQLAMDALRHWATVYGVDGFRFDLGTVLGRDRDDRFDRRRARSSRPCARTRCSPTKS